MAELDLRTGALFDTIIHPGSLTRAMCIVHPESIRPEVCKRSGVHPADVFVRYACGCAFSYCREALKTIYGPNLITEGICPRHSNQDIIEADWIRSLS